MNWIALTNNEQLENVIKESYSKPVLIFKHSTRCAVSTMSLDRLERKWEDSLIASYFLNLIQYREMSNFVAEHLKVTHESPQVILLKDGKVIYHASHNAISFDDIKKMALSSLNTKT